MRIYFEQLRYTNFAGVLYLVTSGLLYTDTVPLSMLGRIFNDCCMLTIEYGFLEALVHIHLHIHVRQTGFENKVSTALSKLIIIITPPIEVCDQPFAFLLPKPKN